MPAAYAELPGGVYVERVPMAGCDSPSFLYSAWEPLEEPRDGRFYSHHTIGGPHWEDIAGPSFDPAVRRSRFMGRVGTKQLPGSIDSIPAGPERSRAVDAWHRAEEARAHALIRAAFPGLQGRESGGSIIAPQ